MLPQWLELSLYCTQSRFFSMVTGMSKITSAANLLYLFTASFLGYLISCSTLMWLERAIGIAIGSASFERYYHGSAHAAVRHGRATTVNILVLVLVHTAQARWCRLDDGMMASHVVNYYRTASSRRSDDHWLPVAGCWCDARTRLHSESSWWSQKVSYLRLENCAQKVIK